eukprot:COSAG05_NODE_1144_length_5733_cov_162.189208_5_plen_106_part_00
MFATVSSSSVGPTCDRTIHQPVTTPAKFFESAENSAPLLPRTCMFCKIFSDDQEMATNQQIGLCDYLWTERLLYWRKTSGVMSGQSIVFACIMHGRTTPFFCAET